MKLKNVNIIDRHIEKIVIAIALLVAAAVVVLYAVGQPYASTLGNRQGVAPGDVGTHLRTAGERLQRELDEGAVIPEPPVEPHTERWVNIRNSPPSPDVVLPVPIGQPGLSPGIVGTTETAPITDVFVAKPPPPNVVAADQGHYLLGRLNDPDQDQELVQLIGSREPRDVRAVSIAAIFDLDAYRRLLQSAPPGQAMDESWWRPMLFLTDVTLQRRALDPATGQWGPVEDVPPLPGQRSWRESAAIWSPARAVETVREIRSRQDEIARPPFLPLGGGQPWQPPGARQRLTAEQQRRLAQINAEITQLQNQLGSGGAADGAAPPGRIRRFEDEGGEFGPGMTRPPGAGMGEDAMGPGPGARPAGPGGPGGPAGAPPRPGGPAARPDAARPGARPGQGAAAPGGAADPQSLQQQLQEKLRERDRLLGLQPSQVAQPRDPRQGDPRDGEPGSEFQGGLPDKVQVWAHDVTVEPGVTYQYRLAVSLLNPLFQNESLTPEQRRQYYNRLALQSDFSEWSRPITIEPEHYFFLVGGMPEKNSALVEVWHVYNGAWRPKQYQVQNGDPIGGSERVEAGDGVTELDLDVDATVVDLDFTVPATGRGRTTRMLYLDEPSDTIRERTAELDSNHPKRLEFRNQPALAGVARAQ